MNKECTFAHHHKKNRNLTLITQKTKGERVVVKRTHLDLFGEAWFSGVPRTTKCVQKKKMLFYFPPSNTKKKN